MHVREAARRARVSSSCRSCSRVRIFCIDRSDSRNALARPFRANKTVSRFAKPGQGTRNRPARVVLRRRRRTPLQLADDDRCGRQGSGLYRKSHIPDSPGYYEKYYFADGDTGFVVHETAVGRIGAGICWDQWFPEAARCMVLKGAEISLIYPTAIGSELGRSAWDTRDHWQRVMVVMPPPT